MLTNAEAADELSEVARFCSRLDDLAAELSLYAVPLTVARRLLATSGAIQWGIEGTAAELSGLSDAADTYGRSAAERLADRYVLEHDRLCEPVRIEGEDGDALTAVLFAHSAK